MNYYDAFVQLPQVPRGLHVGNVTWNDGKKVEEHLLLDVMDTVKPWIVELLNFKQYKVGWFQMTLNCRYLAKALRTQ